MNFEEINSKFDNLQIEGHFISKKFDKKNFQSSYNLNLMNNKKIIIPQQTHSANVKFSDLPGSIPRCDGVFTSNPELVCSLKVADCMPIYFAHKSKIIFGLVHAGWRGLTSGILKNTGKLLKNLKYELKNFDIVIGPSIQDCCFEIADDIKDHFSEQYLQIKTNGKYRVNIQNIAVDFLIKIGFSKQAIHIIDDCTFCMEEFYYSFRRDNGTQDRMVALIRYKNHNN